jgi:hypothetical protein
MIYINYFFETCKTINEDQEEDEDTDTATLYVVIRAATVTITLVHWQILNLINSTPHITCVGP